jgi:hypothetical protein
MNIKQWIHYLRKRKKAVKFHSYCVKDLQIGQYCHCGTCGVSGWILRIKRLKDGTGILWLLHYSVWKEEPKPVMNSSLLKMYQGGQPLTHDGPIDYQFENPPRDVGDPHAITYPASFKITGEPVKATVSAEDLMSDDDISELFESG